MSEHILIFPQKTRPSLYLLYFFYIVSFMQNIKIIKKPRKSMTITIKPDGQILVYAPLGYPDYKIQQRITSKKVWIERTQKRIAAKQPLQLSADQCLLFGEVYTLIPENKSSLQQVWFNTEKKTLCIPQNTSKEERLRALAKSYLHKKFTYRVEQHACQVEKLYIRSQTTKRGTCSSKRNIWLNRKLITLPERVIDYVICHELAHLTHMNHSKRFRDHCNALYPKTNEAKKWLKQHGHIVG